ncbi:MAG: transglutaminase domain-containing protein, partial [Planctomycetota bacterium]
RPIGNGFHNAVRLGPAPVLVDAEGVWHAADGQPLREPYEVWSYPPLRAGDLPEDAEAVHPDSSYLRDGLPPGVGQEVRAYALQLTKKDLTPLQKARHIAGELRDSGRYAYSLELDELKRTGEPVAGFLLSEAPSARRGQCGHFASAFVLLCRLNRIPARLAKGFAASMPQDWPEGAAQRVVFRNSDAHAWGEVFFKGRGWVAFDPTPAAAAPAPVATAPAPALVPEPPDSRQRSFISRIWEDFIGYTGKEQKSLYRKLGEPFRGAGKVLGGESSGGWVGALLAWAAAVLTVYWMMQTFLRRGRGAAPRRPAGTVRARAAVAFYNDLLQVLSRRGFVRKPGQTPREFAAHVLRHGGQAFKAVLAVTEIFESVRYGGREISQEEFNRLQDALDYLRELTFVAAP